MNTASQRLQIRNSDRYAHFPLRRERLLLGLILAAYLVVTLLYGIINPLFEAPDEHWHYFTAQSIVQNGRLPSVAPGGAHDEWMRQEAAQPPLYYLAGALLIAPFDTADARERVWLNKFATIGDASDLINANRFIHPVEEGWPWEGYVLSAHLLRIFSTLLGLGTLVCIYLTARLLWPEDPARALLATALVAFLPQFNFQHAAVSNDPLIIFLASGALWQLVRLWQAQVTRPRLLALGLTVGLAALAKNAGIILLLYALGVLSLLALRDAATRRTGESWRLVAAAALLVLLPALLIAGWVWLRNWSLYGDFTATNQFIRLADGDRGYSLWQVLRESSALWHSSFAVFGWFTVRAADWVYWFWSALVVLSIVGAAWRFITGKRSPMPPDAPAGQGLWARASLLLHRKWVLPALLALWAAAVYGGLVLFMLQTEAAQGRLLFPAILPLALGLAAGLTSTRFLRRLAPFLAVAALGVTVYCLFYVLRPVYEKPVLLVDLPQAAQVIDADMGMNITLQGAEITAEPILPGQELSLVLYWRGREVTEPAAEFVLSVFGRGETEIAKVHSYHGRGLFPAGLWPDGMIVADRFDLRVAQTAQAPVLARLDATLINGNTARVGEAKIVPPSWPPLQQDVLAQIGPVIELVDVSVAPEEAGPGDVLRIEVRWQARGDPETDYTTLIHLGQADAVPLATGDRPPLAGSYPTRVWENGEQFDDFYELALPDDLGSGRYPVWIGLYDTESLDRLPLTIGNERQPHDVYLAGWVDIEADES